MNLFCRILQVFTFSQKISVNFQLLLRFIQGVSFLLAIAGLVAAIVITSLTVPDIFACVLAFVPTGWGILSVSFDDNFNLCTLIGHIYETNNSREREFSVKYNSFLFWDYCIRINVWLM